MVRIDMRTENELMNLILQIADSIEVEAIALSGSRNESSGTKDEFQDYDVVYMVDDLEDLISDLSWLDQYGNRLIEQHNRLGHRRSVSHALWRWQPYRFDPLSQSLSKSGWTAKQILKL